VGTAYACLRGKRFHLAYRVDKQAGTLAFSKLHWCKSMQFAAANHKVNSSIFPGKGCALKQPFPRIWLKSPDGGWHFRRD
jgi:hypothetical protein